MSIVKPRFHVYFFIFWDNLLASSVKLEIRHCVGVQDIILFVSSFFSFKIPPFVFLIPLGFHCQICCRLLRDDSDDLIFTSAWFYRLRYIFLQLIVYFILLLSSSMFSNSISSFYSKTVVNTMSLWHMSLNIRQLIINPCRSSCILSNISL